MDLELAHREEGDRVILTATGELDVYTSDRFHDYTIEILNNWRHDYLFRWIFDFSGLEFLDSAGLHALIVCYKSTADRFGLQYDYSKAPPGSRAGPALNPQGDPVVTLILPPRIGRIFLANLLQGIFKIEVTEPPSSE